MAARWREHLNRFGRTVLVLTALLVVVWTIAKKVDDAVNPKEINHLVITNWSGREYAAPILLTMDGNIRWQQSEDRGISGVPGGSVVYNVQNAFGRGTLTLTGSDGEEIVAVDLQPPARYCGTLFIRLDENGEVQQEFNSIPEADAPSSDPSP